MPLEAPSNFDPFAASSKIDVHQDNIGMIAHGLQKGFLAFATR